MAHLGLFIAAPSSPSVLSYLQGAGASASKPTPVRSPAGRPVGKPVSTTPLHEFAVGVSSQPLHATSSPYAPAALLPPEALDAVYTGFVVVLLVSFFMQPTAGTPVALPMALLLRLLPECRSSSGPYGPHTHTLTHATRTHTRTKDVSHLTPPPPE